MLPAVKFRAICRRIPGSLPSIQFLTLEKLQKIFQALNVHPGALLPRNYGSNILIVHFAGVLSSPIQSQRLVFRTYLLRST